MNVLVYSDVGASTDWLARSRAALHAFLGPSYDVMPVYARQLTVDPWLESTALLVFPGGRDLPYCAALNGRGNARIREYVDQGGKYLGICAGAYFASLRVEFEVGTPLEVTGNRELAFFDGPCIGAVWPGFRYNSEAGARTARVSLNKNFWQNNAGWADVPAETDVYWNGGGAFELSPRLQADPRFTVVGRYSELPGQPVAGVHCRVGRGQALLWNVHPEHTTLPGHDRPSDLTLLRESLRLLGLRPAIALEEAPRIHPQHILADRDDLRDAFEQSLLEKSNDGLLVDQADRFRIAHSRTEVRDNENGVLFDGSASAQGFSSAEYFETLGARGSYGHLMLYSPVVSSTQTLLDKNPSFLSCCPDGLVSVAQRQVAGRGRGSNAWVSPLGCLCMSLVVRAPPRLAGGIVFAQYLFALAVVEGVHDLLDGADIGVRLKWPNDIYADLGAGKAAKDRYKKLGGILVNSSFAGSEFSLVIGCGLNVLNERPTLALRDLVPDALRARVTIERVLAKIIASFEELWKAFLAGDGSFRAFADRYTSAWIHSNQEITIAATGQRVRIVGISSDHGLLRTVPADGSPGFIDLQPDGNSFDMLQNLIKVKT